MTDYMGCENKNFSTLSREELEDYISLHKEAQRIAEDDLFENGLAIGLLLGVPGPVLGQESSESRHHEEIVEELTKTLDELKGK